MVTLRTGSSGAVAMILVALIGGVGGCTKAPPGPDPDGAATSPPPISASVSIPAGPDVVSVPIYYTSGGEGPSLYREYHRVKVVDSSMDTQVKAAVTKMLDGRSAYDNDYVSTWPASASVRSVTVTDGIATVDLHGATVNADDPAANAAAMQQLIWTATANTGGTGIKLLFDGKARSTLWKSKQPVAGVLHRAPAVDALAPVWVIDPQAEATTGTHLTAHVAGIVFEATMTVTIHDSDGRLVSTRVVQLSKGAPSQGTATLKYTLAPGRYTIEASAKSVKDPDGPKMQVDRHTFTVAG